MPSSRGSSLPRDQTSLPCGFCIAGGFFTAELPGKPIIRMIHLLYLRIRAWSAMSAILSELEGEEKYGQ